MGRCHPLQMADVNIIGGESASLTNPKKGRAGNPKKNYSDRLKDTSTGDHR